MVKKLNSINEILSWLIETDDKGAKQSQLQFEYNIKENGKNDIEFKTEDPVKGTKYG